MNENERLALKQDGFFAVRDSDLLSVRFSSGGGAFTAHQMVVLGEMAERYGNGNVAITSRLSAEVVGIRQPNIEAVKEMADEARLVRGLSGPRIRTVTSCMDTYCVKGTFDTFALAREIDERYTRGEVPRMLPNRFKICVGGCPNSCMKPALNDFGIEGHIEPVYDAAKCRSCRICQIERHCPSHAISFPDGKVHVEEGRCRTCGVCRGKCPFHVFDEHAQTRFQIYLGGTWGRTSRMGDRYLRPIERAEIFPLLDATLAWYAEHAQGNERFGHVLERLGFDAYLRDAAEALA